MSIKILGNGAWEKTTKYLEETNTAAFRRSVEKLAKVAVDKLEQVTPRDTGKTSAAWEYTISQKNGVIELAIHNHNTNLGYNVAILILYGHATGTGGYVRGQDYLNPVLDQIFKTLLSDINSITKS